MGEGHAGGRREGLLRPAQGPSLKDREHFITGQDLHKCFGNVTKIDTMSFSISTGKVVNCLHTIPVCSISASSVY